MVNKWMISCLLPVGMCFAQANSSSFGGVGLGLTCNGITTTVGYVIAGSVSDKHGVAPGDTLLSVDGWSANSQSISDIVARVRGDVGSGVSLQFGGRDKPYSFATQRESILIVESKVSDFALNNVQIIDSAQVLNTIQELGYSTSNVVAILSNGQGFTPVSINSLGQIAVVLASTSQTIAPQGGAKTYMKTSSGELLLELDSAGTYQLDAVTTVGDLESHLLNQYLPAGESQVLFNSGTYNAFTTWLVLYRNGNLLSKIPLWSLQ